MQPDEWEMIKNQAKCYADSRLFDRTEHRETVQMTPQEIATIMMLGRDLHVGETIALLNVSILRGKINMKTMFMVGLATRVGVIEQVDELCTDESATVRYKRHEWAEDHTLTYTMEQVKKLGFYEKNNQYKLQPANMILQRALAAAARLVAPDQLAGIYSEVEVDDMVEERSSNGAAKGGPPKSEDRSSAPPQNPLPASRNGDLTEAEQARLAASLKPAAELEQPEFDMEQAVEDADHAPEQGWSRAAAEQRVAEIIQNRCGEVGKGWTVTGNKTKDADTFRKYLGKTYNQKTDKVIDWSDETLKQIDHADRIRSGQPVTA